METKRITKTKITSDQFVKLMHLTGMGGFAKVFADRILLRGLGMPMISDKQAALLDKLADENAHRACKWDRCPNCYSNDGEELVS